MSVPDSSNVTLAYVDPDVLSCWEGKVKKGLECTLTLQHKQGKITTTLQCHSSLNLDAKSLSSLNCQADNIKKKKKNKGDKSKRLESLLSYHQRLVDEKGLPESELMKKHAAIPPTHPTNTVNKFYCNLCEYTSTSQRGVNTHKGHKHKEQLQEGQGEDSLELSLRNEVKEEDINTPLAESTLNAEGDGIHIFKCNACDFQSDCESGLKSHKQIHHSETISGLIVIRNIDKETNVDAQKQEMPPEQAVTEDVLTLKLDLEYWTWPKHKAPPPKVHHPQEGLGTSPNLYTDALGFDQISYIFKIGVHDVFEIT